MMARSSVVRWNMLNPYSGWVSNEDRFLRKGVTTRRHRPEGVLVLRASHPVRRVCGSVGAVAGGGGGDVMNGIIGGQQGWA